MRRETFLAGMVVVALTLSAAQAAAPVSFMRQVPDFVADQSPYGVAAADVDGDGKVDLVVANNDGDNVSVLWGDGNGGFLDSGAPFPTGVGPFAVAVGDFNNDGKLDIVTSDEIGDTAAGGTVTLLLNQGNRAFAAGVSTDTGGSPQAIVVGDFDGDGLPDVATANNFDGTVSILHNLDNGTLFLAQTVTIGPEAEPVGLVLADLNGDGRSDMVVTNSAGGTDGNGTVSVLKGVAGGMFEAQPEIPLPGDCSTIACVPVAVAVADLNGDTKPDIVVANNEDDTVSVLLGNCDLTFNSGGNFPVDASPEWVVAADFNRDGHVDIATSSDFGNLANPSDLNDKVSVLLGNGDGTFMPLVDFDVGLGAFGIVAADLNSDHKPDIASANVDDGTVSVLLNTTPPAQTCAGDCNGNGQVSVDEVITLVNITLAVPQPSACTAGGTPVSVCTGGDLNGDGQITIDEIVAAVSKALNGCT
jgi:hypothetical protein